MAPKKPDSEFSDSEKAALDAFLQEREHEAWLDARRKKRNESIKGWSNWIVGVSAALFVLRDAGAAAWKLIAALWASKP